MNHDQKVKLMTIMQQAWKTVVKSSDLLEEVNKKAVEAGVLTEAQCFKNSVALMKAYHTMGGVYREPRKRNRTFQVDFSDIASPEMLNHESFPEAEMGEGSDSDLDLEEAENNALIVDYYNN